MVKLPAYLYRDERAGELLELFMVASVTTLLLNRFVLFILDYPMVGGGKLHIAHMLWGGLLMTTGLVLMMAFLGYRVKRLSSIVSGIGFGLFIDELGKFITSDNDYFFRPTIALIYLIFVGMFLLFRSLSQRRRLRTEEYLLNALSLAEEAVIMDLSSSELKQALKYLEKADDANPMTKALTVALKSVKPATLDDRNWLQRWIDLILDIYLKFIKKPHTITTINLLFAIKALLFPISLIIGPYDILHSGLDSTADWFATFQIISSIIAGGFVIDGILKINSHRIIAYERFSQSLLIDIFITQFFSFYLSQFKTVFILFINVTLYFTIKFFIEQEVRLKHK